MQGELVAGKVSLTELLRLGRERHFDEEISLRSGDRPTWRGKLAVADPFIANGDAQAEVQDRELYIGLRRLQAKVEDETLMNAPLTPEAYKRQLGNDRATWSNDRCGRHRPQSSYTR